MQPRSLSKDEPMMNMNAMHMMEYYSDFKAKEILSQATTWMKREDIKLSEKAIHKRVNTVFFHLHEVSSQIHRK